MGGQIKMASSSVATNPIFIDGGLSLDDPDGGLSLDDPIIDGGLSLDDDDISEITLDSSIRSGCGEKLRGVITKRRNEDKMKKQMKKMDFCDDIWGLIKEFAGIYNLKGWDKIGKLGIDKIHNFYRQNYRRRLTNYKKNAYTSKVMIFKKILPSITYERSVKLLDLLPKPKEDMTIKNQSIFKVGDEVATYDFCGIIKKIGKKISIKKYTEEKGYDKDHMAIRNQTYTEIIYKYNKSVLQKVCCISADSIRYIKRDGIIYSYNTINLTKVDYDIDYFNHRSISVDYGN